MSSAMDHDGIMRKLMERSIEERDVRIDGPLTVPPTWGVYEIEPPERGSATRRFRTGNHPVRERELQREFGAVRRIALFKDRDRATELQRYLNAAQ